MYAGFFGLRELPFNNTPDPRFFYPTSDHEEALASLIYAVRERKGFVLLTGEIGAGKTLIARMMLRHFGSRIVFAAINHAVQDAGDLMESVCTEFELTVRQGASNTRLVRSLQDYLLEQFAQNTPVALVLDEAQNLSVEAFEQLRMIGNLEADDAKLLQIVIVGQPELRTMFASRELRQLRQRVFRSFHLPALSCETTKGYIHHRLTIAGATHNDIFEPGAIDHIFVASKGLPRLINAICDNAMLSAYSADRKTIDAEFVRSVVQQMLMIGGPDSHETCLPRIVETPTAPHAPANPTEYIAAGSAGSLPTTAQALAGRIAAVEDRLSRTYADAHAAAAGTQVSRQSNEHVELNRRLDLFEHQVQQRVDQTQQRVAHLEHQLKTATGVTSDALQLTAHLQPLVQEAQRVLIRTSTTLRTLAEHEDHARKLPPKLNALIEDVGQMLEGMKLETQRGRRTEQNAKDVLDRLIAQTKRSQQFADAIGTLVDRKVTARTEPAPPPGVVKTASKPTTAVLGLSTEPASGADDRNRLMGMLSNTRKSLVDLRTLVRSSCDSTAIQTQGSDTPATMPGDPCRSTDRLEHQVGELLDLIGSGPR